MVFGIATAVFGLSTSLPLSMACLFVTGAADMISVYVRQSFVQGETPDAMRGRVAAVNTVFIGASNELGEFESGTLAAAIGAVPAVVLGGVATVGVALLWAPLPGAPRPRQASDADLRGGLGPPRGPPGTIRERNFLHPLARAAGCTPRRWSPAGPPE